MCATGIRTSATRRLLRAAQRALPVRRAGRRYPQVHVLIVCELSAKRRAPFGARLLLGIGLAASVMDGRRVVSCPPGNLTRRWRFARQCSRGVRVGSVMTAALLPGVAGVRVSSHTWRAAGVRRGGAGRRSVGRAGRCVVCVTVPGLRRAALVGGCNSGRPFLARSATRSSRGDDFRSEIGVLARCARGADTLWSAARSGGDVTARALPPRRPMLRPTHRRDVANAERETSTPTQTCTHPPSDASREARPRRDG